VCTRTTTKTFTWSTGLQVLRPCLADGRNPAPEIPALLDGRPGGRTYGVSINLASRAKRLLDRHIERGTYSEPPTAAGGGSRASAARRDVDDVAGRDRVPDADLAAPGLFDPVMPMSSWSRSRS